MSFFEYFSSLNIPWRGYFFEYAEFTIGLVCCFFSYRAGRVGLSTGITVVLFLLLILFDHFWLYFMFSLDYTDLIGALYYNGFAFSGFSLIVFCYFLHLRFNLEFSRYAVLFLNIRFLGVLLQIFTYIDINFFELKHMKYIFPVGVPLINFLSTFCLSMGVYDSYRKSKAMPQRIPFSWE